MKTTVIFGAKSLIIVNNEAHIVLESISKAESELQRLIDIGLEDRGKVQNGDIIISDLKDVSFATFFNNERENISVKPGEILVGI